MYFKNVLFSTLLILFYGTLLAVECTQLPAYILKLEEPSEELLLRLEQYEKDSFPLLSSTSCQLEFICQKTYILRRTEHHNQADSLIQVAEKQYNLDEFPFIKTRLLVEKAVLLHSIGNAKVAEKTFLEIKSLFRNHNFFENEPFVLKLTPIAIAAFSDGEDYTFANELIEKQIEFNKSGEPFYYFHNYFMLGLNNLNSHSYHKAHGFFRQAYVYSENSDSTMLAELAVLYATSAMRIDSLNAAEDYFQRAMNLGGDKVHIRTFSLLGLAELYEEQNKFEALNALTNDLYALIETPEYPINFKKDVCYHLMHIHFHNKEKGKFHQNKKVFLKDLDTTGVWNKNRFYKTKTLTAAIDKFTPQEFSDFRMYVITDIEMRNQNAIEHSNSLILKYETQQKEAANQLLRQEKKLQTATIQRQRISMWTGLGGLGLLGVVAFLFYRQAAERKENNQALKKKNEKIETLHRELSHRVKNNLALVSSLMKMQGRRLDSTEAKMAVREGEARVQAMSLLHRRLYLKDDKQPVSVDSYLQELCTNLQKMYPHLGKPVDFEYQIDAIVLDGESSMRLGLIVNELVTNSFKYAFEQQANPKISVSFNAKDKQHYELRYTDNGKGIDAEFDIAKSTSLGLKLIQSLVQQLHGKASFGTGNGFDFRFDFPKETLTG